MHHLSQLKSLSLLLALVILLVSAATYTCGTQTAYAAADEPAVAQGDSSNTANSSVLPGSVDPINFMFAVITLGAVMGLRALILKKKPEDADM